MKETECVKLPEAIDMKSLAIKKYKKRRLGKYNSEKKKNGTECGGVKTGKTILLAMNTLLEFIYQS